MNNKTKLQKFERRKRMMIAGIIIALFGIMFYIVNGLTNLLPHTFNLPVFVICIFISLMAYMLYLCPFCGKYPETTDVPLLNPERCAKCEARLK